MNSARKNMIWKNSVIEEEPEKYNINNNKNAKSENIFSNIKQIIIAVNNQLLKQFRQFNKHRRVSSLNSSKQSNKTENSLLSDVLHRISNAFLASQLPCGFAVHTQM
jgi:predicted glycosyl hydrolase (DUF1957 family)